MKKLLREPLVHFLLLGGLLFLFFAARGGSGGPLSTRIAVTPGQVQHLAAGYARTWSRPPTGAELKGLIDEYVKEEIATREATALGLDRDDTVIRQRLRQKLEFLGGDSGSAAPPTDAEIAAWRKAHPGAFGGELQLSFRQVFLRADHRKEASAEAGKLLSRLRAAGPDAPTGELGDATMLPAEMPVSPLREVAAIFGETFARQLAAAPPGEWSGPFDSSYGRHLVLVRERVAAEEPSLASIRPLVEREVLAERQRLELQALYERLLAKYTVTIEMPKADTGPGATGAAGTR